jgi:photosystem II stability/assembly factor-like uncharacterized protein
LSAFAITVRFTATLVSRSSALLLALLAIALPSFAQPQSWQPVGPPGGDVISLAISPQNSLYLGTADGHIFISRDAGSHWALRGRVSSRHDAVIQKLLVDRRDENHLLAAVWFQDVNAGGALYGSNDAGATWSVAGLSGEILRTVEQSPSSPEIFVAGTRSGVFRSTDAAQSWQRISPAGDPELRNVDSVAIDPRDPQTIYAGTYHLPWKTTDAGKTWNAVSSGMIDDSDVMSLRVDASSSARIFASACSGIYRSENAGALWTKLQGIPYSSRRTQSIVQDPQDPRVLYAATTEGLWLTRDGGESWTRTTPRDWVVNDVAVLPSRDMGPGVPPASSSRVLLATEAQGLLLSNDAGLTFAPANEGFSHRITAALASDPRNTQHLLAWTPGAPDPLLESQDGGLQWQALPGTSSINSAEIARLFTSDSGWWLANANGALFLYDSGAARWNAFRFAPAPTRKYPHARSATAAHRRSVASAPAPPAVMPPGAAPEIYDLRTVGARIFVATSQALWSGTLGEKILRLVPPSAIAKGISAPDSSPDTDARLWMATGGKILFSGNEGKNWQEESQPIASDVSPADVRWLRELSAAAQSASAPPAVPANPQNDAVLLAGTTKGIYRRSPGSTAWQLVQSGLPAGEPASYFFHNSLCLIAMRAGGLYASRDASQTWERLDTGVITGQFTGAAATADGAIVAASLTEGLLQYSSPSSSN